MATESDNVNSGILITLVAVLTTATLGIALVVTALVRSEIADEHEKKDVSADRPYRDMVAEQTAKLNAPAAYLDRGKGLVTLPIDRAMELTVSGLKKDPNSATPPAAAGGTSGADSGTAAGGSGGSGGASTDAGAAAGAGGTTAAPPNEATHAEGGKPAEAKDEKKEDKKDEKKKEAPKPKLAPVAPAPAPAAPAPAPAPAPNGQ